MGSYASAFVWFRWQGWERPPPTSLRERIDRVLKMLSDLRADLLASRLRGNRSSGRCGATS